jgi:hypothetical protein
MRRLLKRILNHLKIRRCWNRYRRNLREQTSGRGVVYLYMVRRRV